MRTSPNSIDRGGGKKVVEKKPSENGWFLAPAPGAGSECASTTVGRAG
jgi:hypothetical protein